MPSLDWVIVFLKSAHLHMEHTQVILFVDTSTRDSLHRISAIAHLEAVGFLNLTIVPERYLLYPLSINISNSANNFRFVMFRDWMAEAATRSSPPKHVMISDVTDVYFQSDPFQVLSTSSAGMHFTLEDASRNLGNEKYNKRWLSCYGPDVVRKLRNGRITCAGVTLGHLMSMLKYTMLQVEELSKPSLLECSRNKILAALDQATHNYILHERSKEEIPGDVVASSDVVFHGNFGKPTWDRDHQHVLNPSGVPYPVVHQYTSNRHPGIMEVAKAKYGI
jgi:hypothetical protein